MWFKTEGGDLYNLALSMSVITTQLKADKEGDAPTWGVMTLPQGDDEFFVLIEGLPSEGAAKAAVSRIFFSLGLGREAMLATDALVPAGTVEDPFGG